jgi:hypothetical protein
MLSTHIPDPDRFRYGNERIIFTINQYKVSSQKIKKVMRMKPIQNSLAGQDLYLQMGLKMFLTYHPDEPRIQNPYWRAGRFRH